MGKLIVEIPEEVQAALRLPPDEAEQELRKELAVALYRRGVLGHGVPRAAHRDRRDPENRRRRLALLPGPLEHDPCRPFRGGIRFRVR